MWVAVGLVVVLSVVLLFKYVFGSSGPSPFDFDSREPLKPMVLDEKEKNKGGKISLEELTDFVRKHGLRSITNNIIRAMYNEITGRRVVIKKHLQDKPITFEELRFCCNYW